MFMFLSNSNILTLAALILITTLQQVDGEIFNSNSPKSPVEYMDRKFYEIIGPVRLMFSNIKDCALEFIKILDRDKLKVCVSNAFEYTGLDENAPLKSFERNFQSTFTSTCKMLSKLVSQQKKGTLALDTVDDAVSDEDKLDKLKEIVKYDVACNVVSEQLTVAEVYEAFTGKA